MLSGEVKQTHKDIITFPANTKGRDIIIADLHGNSACLANLIDELKLTEHDRLFIAGDLVDRGKDSEGVIELIQKHKNIHVIRGNHECMTIDSIAALEVIIKEIARQFGPENVVKKCNDLDAFEEIIERMPVKDKAHVCNLINHVKHNEGEWLVELFQRELAGDPKIAILPDMTIKYDKDSKIKLIWDYFNRLPYIIHVAGNDSVMPLNVVHADMPINDAELFARIESNKGLTADEIRYATWAREKDFKNVLGRGEHSIISYCGHTVVTKREVDCVRRNTSHIDLDNASYLFGVAILVDHTNGKVCCLGPDKAILSDYNHMTGILINQKAAEVRDYLDERKLDFEIDKIKNKFTREVVGIADVAALSELYKSVTERISSMINAFNLGRGVDVHNENTRFDLAMHFIQSDQTRTVKMEFIDRFLCICKKEIIETLKNMDNQDDARFFLIGILTDLNKLLDAYNKQFEYPMLYQYTAESLREFIADEKPRRQCVLQTGIFSTPSGQQESDKFAVPSLSVLTF